MTKTTQLVDRRVRLRQPLMNLLQQLELRHQVRIGGSHARITSHLKLLLVRRVADAQSDAVGTWWNHRPGDTTLDDLIGYVVVVDFGGVRVAQVPGPTVEPLHFRNARLLLFAGFLFLFVRGGRSFEVSTGERTDLLAVGRQKGQ